MDAVKSQDKNPISKLKDYWDKEPPKKKKGIIAVAISVVLVAAIIVVVLNITSGSGYKVLYPGLDASEMPEVYAAVQELGVQPQVNGSGELMVPESEYDSMLLQLSAQGFPKSTLPYSIFFDHNGLTTTEFEKKQLLIYQLQNRLQDTLKRMDGVTDAVVTVSIPETSDYVWQQATQNTDSTGSVLLTLKPRTELTEEQVYAVKNLVASSTPQLVPENVKVVDASTKLELNPSYESGSGTLGNSMTMKLEQQAQKQMEDNVVRLLAPRYSNSGVVAAAKVTLDFDKMMEERKEILREENNNDAVTHFEEQYGVTGTQPAAGIVGETDNTEIPNYAYTDPTGDNGMTDYSRSIDYDYGYIKTQIEKGAAAIKESSISVMVNDLLTEVRRAELVDLISKSTGIVPENISVAPMNPPAIEEEPPVEPPAEPDYSWLILPLLLIGAFVILVILVCILLYRRRSKRLEAMAAEKDVELENQAESMQEEIERYKKELEDAARAKTDPKDDAITDEVRDFAKENPEITATLLRSWLKEDE